MLSVLVPCFMPCRMVPGTGGLDCHALSQLKKLAGPIPTALLTPVHPLRYANLLAPLQTGIVKTPRPNTSSALVAEVVAPVSVVLNSSMFVHASNGELQTKM